MPSPHLFPTLKGNAEHSLQSGRARSPALKSVSTPWRSPRGTYLFFMTFKLVHPEVLHLPGYCLSSGVRALVYPLVSCCALLISVPLAGGGGNFWWCQVPLSIMQLVIGAVTTSRVSDPPY